MSGAPKTRSFVFQALEPGGRVVEGICSAADLAEAAEQLRGQRLLPTSLRQAWPFEVLLRAERRRRLSSASARRLLRILAELTAAHATVVDALSLARDSWPKAGEISLLDSIIAEVRRGIPLSEALAAHLASEIVHILRAGETSGSLAAAIDRAASLLEARAAQASRILQASIYPMILLAAAMVVVSILFVVVVPNIQPLVSDRMNRLPLFSQGVFALSELIQTHGPLMLSSILGLSALLGLLLSLPQGRAIVVTALWRTPGLAAFRRKQGEAAVLQTLAALTKAGVGAGQALTLAAEATHRPLKATVLDAVAEVRKGRQVADVLLDIRFAPDAILMIRAGERAGDLASGLARAAAQADARLTRMIDTALSLLAPALTLLIGLIAGLVVAAVFGAVMAVNEVGG